MLDVNKGSCSVGANAGHLQIIDERLDKVEKAGVVDVREAGGGVG